MKDATIKDLLARLVLATGVASDGALSGVLGVSSQAVYDAKKREKIPDSWIRVVAEKFNVSADWLFFGRGPMHPGEAPQPRELQANAPEIPLEAAGACPRCAKLEEKLERVERQRDELVNENRDLLRENGNLREENATMRERLRVPTHTGTMDRQTA